MCVEGEYAGSSLGTASFKVAWCRAHDFWSAMRAIGLLLAASLPEERQPASPATVSVCRRGCGCWWSGETGFLLASSAFGSGWCRVILLLRGILWCAVEESSRSKEASTEGNSSPSHPGGLRCLRHVAPSAVASSRSVLFFPFWSRLGHVVIGFAERTAGTAAREPRVDTGSVEGVATGQAANVVVILKGINTNGAAVTGCSEHLGRCCGPDRVVIVLIRDRSATVFLVDRSCSLRTFNRLSVLSMFIFAGARGRWLLTVCLRLCMITPGHVKRGALVVLHTLPSTLWAWAGLLDARSTARRRSHTANSR